MKRALVFGGSGQIGRYLCELLSEKGYVVYAPSRLDCNFEVSDPRLLRLLIDGFKPDEIYNMAGLNYAPDSWSAYSKYMRVNGMAVIDLLEVIRLWFPKVRFFQAGSAEVFERATVQQAEDTNRLPDNPYGLSKMMALEAVRIYRDKYKLWAFTGIFFNAESPRRGKTFFAEKVAAEAVRIRKEWNDVHPFSGWKPITLGTLDARRDWGWAPEYAEVAWRMLQTLPGKDFVIGTGETHTCYEFVVEALQAAGLPNVTTNFDKYVWYDKGVSNPKSCMRAVPTKAEKLLGWKAQVTFKEVVRRLVEAELNAQTVTKENEEAKTSNL